LKTVKKEIFRESPKVKKKRKQKQTRTTEGKKKLSFWSESS